MSKQEQIVQIDAEFVVSEPKCGNLNVKNRQRRPFQECRSFPESRPFEGSDHFMSILSRSFQGCGHFLRGPL